MTASHDLGYFDCNVRLGRLAAPKLGSWLDREALQAEMEHHGIAESLVVSTYAKENRAELGNRRLIDEIAGDPRLHPCFVLMPRHRGVDPPEEEQVADMLARGARAVRLYTNMLNETVDTSIYVGDFNLNPVIVGPLLTALERRRVPVFIDTAQASWNDIYAVCERHPDLPLIVTNMSYGEKRFLFAGFERYENLRSDISGYHVHLGLEEVCAEFGPHRLLFGTRLPLYAAGSAVAMVRYADISLDEKRAIAGDNLRRLLAAVEVN